VEVKTRNINRLGTKVVTKVGTTAKIEQQCDNESDEFNELRAVYPPIDSSMGMEWHGGMELSGKIQEDTKSRYTNDDGHAFPTGCEYVANTF